VPVNGQLKPAMRDPNPIVKIYAARVHSPDLICGLQRPPVAGSMSA
jgi:hypothetical protein